MFHVEHWTGGLATTPVNSITLLHPSLTLHAAKSKRVDEMLFLCRRISCEFRYQDKGMSAVELGWKAH